MYRSVVECVSRGDVRDSAIDLGDDFPSREITQNVMFVMTSNGKRQGDQRHFPIIFFQDDAIGETHLVPGIVIRTIEFCTTSIARQGHVKVHDGTGSFPTVVFFYTSSSPLPCRK